MRLPRVRFTVRRMMVVVAIVGVGLGVEAWLKHRGETLRAVAVEHNELVHGSWKEEGVPEPRVILASGKRISTAHLDWHVRMMEKYFKASHRPWLPVPPDPPEPEGIP